MKKIFAVLMTILTVASLTACGQEKTTSAAVNQTSGSTSSEAPAEPAAARKNGNETPVTLTIGDVVLEGYLNDSAPARSLISQLPMTVMLNDSDNDFCGGNLNITYSDKDVTSGYKNGDLAFWTPANNFVIFISGGENSANIGNLVHLGHVTSPQKTLDALKGRINVTIAVKK